MPESPLPPAPRQPPNPPNQQARGRRPNAAPDSESDVPDAAQEQDDENSGDGQAPTPGKDSKFKKTTTGVTRESWFYEMESYMELNYIGRRHWVKTCISNLTVNILTRLGAISVCPIGNSKGK